MINTKHYYYYYYYYFHYYVYYSRRCPGSAHLVGSLARGPATPPCMYTHIDITYMYVYIYIYIHICIYVYTYRWWSLKTTCDALRPPPTRTRSESLEPMKVALESRTSVDSAIILDDWIRTVETLGFWRR